MLRSARPSYVPGPFTVGAGAVQLQAGVEWGEAGKSKVWSAPSILRWGLGSRIEIRGGYRFSQTVANTQEAAVQAAVVGLKVAITPIHQRFKLAAMFHYRRSKNTSEESDEVYGGPEFHLISAYKLAENLGIVWFVAKGTGERQWLRTGPRLNVRISENIRLNFEYLYIHLLQTNLHETRLGLAFWVHPNLMLDVSGSYGLVADTRWTLGTGISWRLLTKN